MSQNKSTHVSAEHRGDDGVSLAEKRQWSLCGENTARLLRTKSEWLQES